MSLAAGVACEFSLALLLNLAIFAAIGESPACGIFTCVSQTCLQPLHLSKSITGLASYGMSAALHVLSAGSDAHIGEACCDHSHIGLKEWISYCRVAAESCRSSITIGCNGNPCGCRSWTDWAQHESSTCLQLELLPAGAVALLLIMKSARMLAMPSQFQGHSRCCVRRHLDADSSLLHGIRWAAFLGQAYLWNKCCINVDTRCAQRRSSDMTVLRLACPELAGYSIC